METSATGLGPTAERPSAVKDGVTWSQAVNFHLELSPHPSGPPKKLWFDVRKDVWPVIYDPDDITIRSVVDAFNGSNLVVMVWHSGQMIHQLTINREKNVALTSISQL